jgi:hypothetical protein
VKQTRWERNYLMIPLYMDSEKVEVTEAGSRTVISRGGRWGYGVMLVKGAKLLLCSMSNVEYGDCS